MSTKRSFDEFKTGLTHLPRSAIMDPAPREVTPPPIQAPSAKERKYDRQLRLWAAAGQRALEDSHVLLVVGDNVGSNSSVAGAEALKNLILPSIGNFTVADAAEVTNEDLGVNFFLESSSLGKSRAEETTRLLAELNPDVNGYSISTPVSEWLPKPDSLRPYNLIMVCAPVPHETLTILSLYALENSIPLIYIHCAGFQSYFSVQLPAEFPIVDTHPDPDSISDLRLLAPWPELMSAVKGLGDISTMSDHDHGHIPYLLILLHYLEEWKSTHDNTPPSTFKEKTQFRDLVRSGARTSNPEGGEENFDEACAAVLKTINPPTVGSSCREMLEMPSAVSPNPTTASNFWIIAHAIRTFYLSHNNSLPLPGSLPDMKATSADYIRLQNLYKSKARSDVAEVTATVRHFEAQYPSPNRPTPIPDGEIEQFCKDAAHVRVLTNPKLTPLPILRLAQSDPATLKSLTSALENYDTISPLFLAMSSPLIPATTLSTLLSSSTPSDENDDDEEPVLQKAMSEFTRCQGAELHNTASITGGMVAQEAIKLLTRQYVPVNGTCLWNGIRSKTEVIKI